MAALKTRTGSRLCVAHVCLYATPETGGNDEYGEGSICRIDEWVSYLKNFDLEVWRNYDS